MVMFDNVSKLKWRDPTTMGLYATRICSKCFPDTYNIIDL